MSLNVGLFVLIVVLAIIAKLYVEGKRNPPTIVAQPRTNTASKRVWVSKLLWVWKVKAFLPTVIGIAGCHALVWYFWPELWWILAKSFLFWLDHLLIFLALVVFRKETKNG